MDYMLTVKSGFTPGVTWRIGERPLLLGRATDCDVVLDDGTISRRHCQLSRDPSGLLLTDLGSRNPVLINGEPSTRRILKVGDELVIGSVAFLITATTEQASPSNAARDTPDTVAIPLDDLALFSGEGRGANSALWLGSIDDYIRLFAFSRKLSLAAGVGDVYNQFQRFVDERLGMHDLALLRPGHGTGTPWVSGATACADVDPSIVENARKSGAAVALELPSANGHSHLFVAPLRCLDEQLGVAAGTYRSNAHDARSSLAVFAAASEILGPYLHAADRFERMTRAARRLESAEFGDPPLIGRSRTMTALRALVSEAAASPLHVLIVGETGTGKELIARNIHNQSGRNQRPYVILNCATVPDALFESELFGHVAGAFTGALGRKQGLMELADGGTLFLDEVGDLSMENQAKLLRAVELGTFRPVGGTTERHVDIRIVAATNGQLHEVSFRTDLYHRLAGWVIEAPPLRQRRDDIPALAQHMVDVLAVEHPHALCTISESALEKLAAQDWPGNVRELRNVVERAAHRCRGGEILPHHVSHQMPMFGSTPARDQSPKTLAAVEREHIEHVLQHCRNNMSKAARVLGISRSTLYLKVDEYAIDHG